MYSLLCLSLSRVSLSSIAMAFKKTLAQRLFNISKISSQSLTNCRISSSSVQARIPATATQPDIAPDPGDNGIFRRFLHKRPVFQPELRSPPLCGNLLDKLRAMDIARNRIRLDGLSPPPEKPEAREGVTIEDAKKLLKAAQLELVKSRLREIGKGCIPLSEFIRICAENCSDHDQTTRIAKMLDDSAAVIIFGDVVFLRPEQEIETLLFLPKTCKGFHVEMVAKSIQALLPVPGAKVYDSVRKELEEMEKEKAAIDNRADTWVRRELWGGLGFLVVQTLAFIRLTFWELTWDVMEPICFYLTSMYFMAGYTFFLRTSKEPSFEGFYQSRFSSKQKRLMKLHNFDMERYNELRDACFPYSSPASPSEFDSSIPCPFDNSPPQ